MSEKPINSTQSGNPRKRIVSPILAFAAMAALVMAGLFASAVTPPLNGPSKFNVEELLEDGVFYVPVAGGEDSSMIKKAKSGGAKLNEEFYEKYHAPLAAAVKSFAQQKNLSLGDQANLFGWLVIQTHNANHIGYLWGGDLMDGPKSGDKTSGIGYDCSGYCWSVWETVAPSSAFANRGERTTSRSSLKIGRRVFPRAKVTPEFMKNLTDLARPGDVIIDPNGHIMLYGYDPRSADRKPIVMENGEFWNTLDKWFLRNKGKWLEVRSTFDEEGRLIEIDRRLPGRALPALDSPPSEPLVVASAENAVAQEEPAPTKKKAKAKTSKSKKGAAPEEIEERPPSPEPAASGSDVDDQIAAMLSQIRAYDRPETFDISKAPPPEPMKPNSKPRIVSVRAPALRLWNDTIAIGILAEDSDGDEVVQYRIRTVGSKQWLKSDRSRFKTSMPGFEGVIGLEFQVVDARGAISPTITRQIELVARAAKGASATPSASATR